jgi:HEAT repeat protein
MQLARHLEIEPLSEAERTQALDAFLSACRDPNDDVSYAIFQSIATFRRDHGFRPEMRPAIAAAVELLSHDRITSTRENFWMLGLYEQEASAAIPRLVLLLDGGNSAVAMEAAVALALIDPTDRRVIPYLRSVLTSCPDTSMREIARKTLRRFRVPLEAPAPPP